MTKLSMIPAPEGSNVLLQVTSGSRRQQRLADLVLAALGI